MQKLALRNASLQAVILPQAGAGLARLDWIAGGAAVPVLRPFTPNGTKPRVNQLGCFVLVPWSNRMAGGFTCGGERYSIAPNREGDQYPIHGHGWEHPWSVEQQSDTEATLTLERRGTPFSFDARIGYALDEHSLNVTLEVLNAGAVALPFGLGLHPYFPRTAGVTLQASARALWQPGPDKLPVHADTIPVNWSFAQPHAVAEGIDHVFEGWDGRAEIYWPEHALRLAIAADTRYYIIYTPEGADFFCFEPVDHLINAHNAPGGAEQNGLSMLAPGGRLSRSFRFSVSG